MSSQHSKISLYSIFNENQIWILNHFYLAELLSHESRDEKKGKRKKERKKGWFGREKGWFGEVKKKISYFQQARAWKYRECGIKQNIINYIK